MFNNSQFLYRLPPDCKLFAILVPCLCPLNKPAIKNLVMEETRKPEDLSRFLEWKNSWSDPEPMDVWQYISFNIHPEDVLLLGCLLLPEFLEYEGGVFLAQNFRQEIVQGRSVYEAELAVNTVLIYELFEQARHVDDPVFTALGQLLQKSWTGQLLQTFPDRTFRVELLLDERNYGPLLRFYQSAE